MNKPNVLLFDIDNTLLDFSAGAMQAMEEIFRAAGLPYAPEMFAVFQVENDKLWARIERGELTIAGLRDVRWQTILARLGLEADGAAMEDAFRDRLHESAVPVAGAPEVLARLHGIKRRFGCADYFVASADDEHNIAVLERGGDGKRFFGVFSLRSECAEVKIEAPDGEYENLIDSSRVTVKDSRIRSDGRPIIFEA